MVPNITAEQLRNALNRDIPGAVVPPTPSDDDHSSAVADDKSAKKHEKKVSLLHTNDTICNAKSLPAVVAYVRDRLGYAYLSDLVVVDYLSDGLFELVYSFYHLDGGGRLVVKVRVPRDAPDVPSLTPLWPGADLNEREAFDLFGINFTGHPYLKRIYMWDEFEGHPMRKDFPKQGDKYLGEV